MHDIHIVLAKVQAIGDAWNTPNEVSRLINNAGSSARSTFCGTHGAHTRATSGLRGNCTPAYVPLTLLPPSVRGDCEGPSPHCDKNLFSGDTSTHSCTHARTLPYITVKKVPVL